jgi:CRISPR-associated protein (TIGR03986 family)
LPDEALHGCKEYEALCPTCRLFGWVYQAEKGERTENKTLAYTGRLRFSHGNLQHAPKKMTRPTTLAILSSPKPTTTYFYLLNSEGKPEWKVTYNTTGARLRGRKFYRHHGSKLDPKEYLRPAKNDEPIRDDQNRSIKDVLDLENRFSFSITFENLTMIELAHCFGCSK